MCLAIPGRVISISETAGDGGLLERTGVVDFGGVHREVSLAFVPEASVGDYVIVHVGFAISTMNEEEANEVFQYLRAMDAAAGDEAAAA